MKTPTVHVGELALNDSGAFKIGPFGSSLKKTELVESGIPVAGIENVLPNNFVKGFRRFITARKFEELSDYEILPDDVLVTTMGTIGRAASAPPDVGRAIFDSHLFRMRVDTRRVFPPYLCYALNSDLVASQLARMARGAIMEGLNTTILRECSIPLPEMPEQRRIAERLEQADRLRRTRRYALELTDTFLPAAFLELFGDPVTNQMGWKISPFEEVAPSRLGKMLDANQQTGMHGRPYLRNENVQWERFDLTEVSVMDFDADDREEFLLSPGDLLICEGGEPGRCAIWRGQLPECYFQKALHRARPVLSKAIPEYLVHLLWSLARRGGLADYVTSATIAHLTGEKLKLMPIPVPPLPLQQKFAALVERVERLRAVQREALRQAEHLFASLLHRAFSGEL
ncbi:MAG: restriction endonuclease subunit S [Terriglobia bacterium]